MEQSRQLYWTTAALLLVGAQAMLGAWHDTGHHSLGITNPPWFDVLILAAVLVGPILGVLLVFTRWAVFGWALLLFSALLAFGANVLGHYVISSPDNVRQLPEGDGAVSFQISAALLLIVQAGLVTLSAVRLLSPHPDGALSQEAVRQPSTRLAPIARPRQVWMRLIYWIVRCRFGLVPTPVQVLMPRQMDVVGVNQRIASIAQKKIGLPAPEANIIRAYAAKLNGCAFCEDLALAEELKMKLGRDRFLSLADPGNSSALSEREKAALALVREYAEHRSVEDATWARAAALFTETELVEVLWLNAAEQYFNALNIPLRIGSDQISDRELSHG